MTAASERKPRPSAPEDAEAKHMTEALDWLASLESADGETRARFERWLSAAPGNAEAFRRAQAAWSSPMLRTAATTLEVQRTVAKGRRRRTRRLFASAAAVLLTLGVALQGDLGLRLRLRADHFTAVGQREDVRLADGSRVLLNTDTALSSHFDAQRRSVRLLRGEVYFDVAGDRARPFEVEAGPVQVNVRGTAFAVRYLGDEAEVSVQRGEVDLLSRQDNARVSLSAGSSIRVGPGGFGARQSERENQRLLAWVQGRLIVENCPLRQVLAELRRYYPGWIIDADRDRENVAVTGNYRLDDPRGILRSLAQVTSSNLHELPHLLILD